MNEWTGQHIPTTVAGEIREFTGLDAPSYDALFGILDDLHADGVTIMVATHDLNLAGAYCDRVVVIADGVVAADGPPAEALAPAVVRRVFETDVQVVAGPGGRPWLTYGC